MSITIENSFEWRKEARERAFLKYSPAQLPDSNRYSTNSFLKVSVWGGSIMRTTWSLGSKLRSSKVDSMNASLKDSFAVYGTEIRGVNVVHLRCWRVDSAAVKHGWMAVDGHRFSIIFDVKDLGLVSKLSSICSWACHRRQSPLWWKTRRSRVQGEETVRDRVSR